MRNVSILLNSLPVNSCSGGGLPEACRYGLAKVVPVVLPGGGLPEACHNILAEMAAPQ